MQDDEPKGDDMTGDAGEMGAMTGGRLQEVAERFRADRRRCGPRIADRRWLEEPLRQWAYALECPDDGSAEDDVHMPDDACAPDDGDAGGRGRARFDDAGSVTPSEPGCPACGAMPLDDDAVAMLAVAMRESLPVRDCLIVSMIAHEPCTLPMLLDMASRPNERVVRDLMTGLLTDSFECEEHMPDTVRCSRGTAMLDAIAAMVPSPWRVQPYAAMSYLLWWMGDARAAAYAIDCLTMDEGCSLAGMVLSLLAKGLSPAWRMRRGCMATAAAPVGEWRE